MPLDSLAQKFEEEEKPAAQAAKPEQQEQQEQNEKKDSLSSRSKEGKRLSEEDHKAIDKGKDLHSVRAESEKIKDQAEELLSLAQREQKISDKEAKDLKQQLVLNQNKETREQILEDIQKRISSVGKTDRNRHEELAEKDPERVNLRKTYESLLKKHEHLLGKKQLDEYLKWFEEQPQTIENLEKQTVAFLQSQIPPRREVFDELKKTLGKYGINSPLDIPYLAQEGLSERKKFLDNLKKAEQHFQQYGGLKEQLYSQKAENAMMAKLCRAENPQEQEFTLQRMEFLEKAENQGYTTLKAAVSANKISQKSMDNILAYYKDLDKLDGTFDGRFESVKLWESFIENESKLEGKLKDVFEADPAKEIPKNEEGFKLSFQIFKDLDYVGKEKFIEEQKQKREKEKDVEKENKELAITAFKHACSQAKIKKTISEKTEKNYHEWIDKNTEKKSYKEVKEFLDILTSETPQEKFKNLRAYEERRKKYQEDVRRLHDVSPQLSDKELKKWEDEYDELGWDKREKKHEDLKKEIQKSLDARTKERFGKVDNKTMKEVKETDEKEKSRADKNKETAMEAIKSLLKLKAYGTAMKRCASLLRDNPEDTEIQKLFDELADHADQATITPDMDEEKELHKRYSRAAEKELLDNTEMKEDSDALQAEDLAFNLMRENIDKHDRTKSAKDRTKKEVLEETRGDQDLNALAEEYMEDSGKEKVLDKTTLKSRDTVTIDIDKPKTRLEEQGFRKKVQKEQDKKTRGGSSVIEFRERNTGKILEKEQAQKEHEKREDRLVDEMVEDMIKILHPDGKPTTDQLKLARKAALERLRKKEETRIENIAA